MRTLDTWAQLFESGFAQTQDQNFNLRLGLPFKDCFGLSFRVNMFGFLRVYFDKTLARSDVFLHKGI